MNTEHRKTDILNKLFQMNITNLISNLATVVEENESLRAQVAALEQEKAALSALPVTEARD